MSSTFVDSEVLQDMAQQLLTAITREDKVVDQDLLESAENLITSHHFYVQLLFVNLIIERMRALEAYFETMDLLTEEIATEDIGEMNSAEKIRGVAAIQSAVKTQLDIVNTMLASKDASAAMISSLKEAFSTATPRATEEGESVLDNLGQMSPEKRQRILKGTIEALRTLAHKEKVLNDIDEES